MRKITRFADIPQFTRSPSYQVDHRLDYLPNVIVSMQRRGLNLEPDFQRGHVWTEAQQRAFVEFILRGGESARHIYFNFRGWQGGYSTTDKGAGEFVIVDGLQRLTAMLRFLNDELEVFGSRYSEFTDKIRHVTLRFHINDLKTRAEVLQWYLETNGGGTPHSEEELQRVRHLLAREEGY